MESDLRENLRPRNGLDLIFGQKPNLTLKRGCKDEELIELLGANEKEVLVVDEKRSKVCIK